MHISRRSVQLLSRPVRHFKHWLCAGHAPALPTLTRIAALLDFARDARVSGLTKAPAFESREALYSHLYHNTSLGPITYLEFGVYRGASIRRWSELQTHPASRFIGFDSFEGLARRLSWNKPRTSPVLF